MGFRLRSVPTIVVLLTGALLALGACDGATAPGSPLVINDDPGSPAWRAVAAGPYNSCATTSDGRVYCWGFSLVSQCTNSGCAVDSVPTRLATSLSFDTVASGGAYHCGVTATHEAYCWGEVFSSLGDGQTRQSAAPVRVAIDAPIAAITAGYDHACALAATGIAFCWGSDALGAGDTASTSSVLPREVATQVRFTTISAGTTQTCGVATDSTAWCWGSSYGTLGVGARDTSCTYAPSCLVANTPMMVDGNLRWLSVSAGNAFTCGVTVDHRGYCWGEVRQTGDPDPPYGALGAGSFVSSKAPLPVVGGLSLRAIVTGTRHACGITLDNVAYCWGDNGEGEMGIGTAGGTFATPQRVAGGLAWAQLSLADHACGITVHSNLFCWGSDFGGGLGDGRVAFTLHPAPTRVSQPTG